MHAYKKKSSTFLVIPLLLIAAASLALFLGRSAESTPAPEASADFVLELDEVDTSLLSHLHPGDRVVDRRSRRILGDILDIQAEQSHTEIYSEARSALVEAPIPGKLQVRLTLRGTEKGGEIFSVGGDAVKLGQTYYLRTYDFSGNGRVVALS